MKYFINHIVIVFPIRIDFIGQIIETPIEYTHYGLELNLYVIILLIKSNL